MNQITSRIKFSLGVLSTTLLLTSQLPKADAALATYGTIIDSPTNLKVSWTWDPEADSTSAPTLDNWLVALATAPLGSDWSVSLGVQHTTAPHPELGESLGTTGGNRYFFGNGAYGKVISETFSVSHSPVHTDIYTFTFDRSMAPENTLVTLTGYHAVPEPLTILGTGVVLGALPVLKKEYAKRNNKKDKDA